MSQEQKARIVSSWLDGMRIGYIARVESVSEDSVSRVIAKATSISRFHLGGGDGSP